MTVSTKSRGFALIAVLVTLLLVAAIALLLTAEGGSEADRAGRGTEALQAQYLAQAALEHAQWSADQRSCAAYGVPTTSFGAHTYAATFNPVSGSPTTVTATATLASGASRTISRSQTPVHQAPSTVTLKLGADPGSDVRLDSSSPTSNYGGATNVRISANPSARLTTLLHFDVSSIPFGARIESARLQLRMWSIQAAGPVAVRSVSSPWVEGTRNGGGTADGATWPTRDGTSAWTTAGGDFGDTVVSRTTISASDSWVAFDLRTLVQSWVSGAPNYGAALIGEGTLRTAEFSSRETNNAADRPTLTITYACECGIACTAPQGVSSKVLMIVSDGGSPSASEGIKKVALESWGYTVDTLDQNAGQAAYDNKVAANDVVFVPVSANPTQVGSKLTASVKGVVSESAALNDELGLASSASYATGDTVTIVSNGHYITQPFAVGPLRVYDAGMEANLVGGSVAPGLASLATWTATPSLAALNAGAQKYGGGTAAGRRVLLPLGRNLDWRYLNNNGRLIVQRALDWSSGVAGPTAHWKLDDAAGTAAIDSEGGHHGTLAGGPIWTTGKLGGALDFDGVDDYVDLTSNAALDDVFAAPATVLAWINPATFGEANYGHVLDKDNSLLLPGSGWSIAFDGLNARLLFQRGFSTAGGQWVTPIGSIMLNTWQHVGVVYDGASAANDPVIYLNGVAQTITEQRAPSGSPTSDAAINLRLGNYALATSNTFDGSIDDVRIYKSALTATDVAEIAGVAGGPIAHWRLDETSGMTAVDSAGGHHGTLASGPAWTTGALGGALTFDGTDDQVIVPHSAALSMTQAFTLAAFVRPSALTGYQVIVNKGDTIPAYNYSLYTTGDELHLAFSVSGVYVEFATTGANLQLNQWYHVAATFDNATDQVHLYINGAQVYSSNTATVQPQVNTGALYIGRSQWTDEHWQGALDDVRIYNRVLAAAEVGALAATGNLGGSGASGYYLDRFPNFTCNGVDEYRGSSGTLDWSGEAWTEVGDDGEACGNDIRATDDSNFPDATSNRLRIRARSLAIRRQVDLSGFTSAQLSFDYRRKIDAGTVAVRVSTNGGSSWNVVGTITAGDDAAYGSVSYDISTSIADKTLIEFATDVSFAGDLYVDDVRIDVAASGAGGGGGGSEGVLGCTTTTVADDFSSNNYSGSSGTLAWTTNWLEINESDGPTGGDERIESSRARVQDNDGGGEGLQREANLSGYTAAELRFTHQRTGLDDANDYVTLDISSNGGANWTELARFAGPASAATPEPATYDITSYIAPNTRIRWLSSAALGGSDLVYFDDVAIELSDCAIQ